MRVLIALEIGCSLNAALARTRQTGGYLLLGGKQVCRLIGHGRQMTGARMERWSNRHRGARKNQANNQQLRSPNCARSFVASVLDYCSTSTNNLGHVIICWMGKLKVKLRRVLTAVEANGSPERGPHQPLLRVHPSTRLSVTGHALFTGRAVFTPVRMEHAEF